MAEMQQLADRLAQLEATIVQQQATIEQQGAELQAERQGRAAAGGAVGGAAAADRAAPEQTLVDLRVGNKPEVFGGDRNEWKNWSFKMKQYLSALDENLHMEVVQVEANPLREINMAALAQDA